MPLHDWTNLDDWETMHVYWIVELGRQVKSMLPAGFRTSLARVVRTELPFDEEEALPTYDPSRGVFVKKGSDVVAVIELIPPHSKNRWETRCRTTDRFIGYLRQGIHLLFVDVHAFPTGFSFHDEVGATLRFAFPALTSPCAVSYSVEERVFGEPHVVPAWQRPLGLAAWPHSLVVGEPLPTMPLPLGSDCFVSVDLEQTYMRAADAYL